MSLSLDDLRAMVKLLKQNHAPPYKVLNSEQARRMTADDPTGRVWHVGEEYYLMRSASCLNTINSFLDLQTNSHTADTKCT